MNVCILGDLHFPFHHKRTLNKLFDRLTEEKFSHIIQIGDLLDQYCFTRFPKKNIRNADREIKYGRELAQEMWYQIHRRQKKAKKVQLLGNHDDRLVKRCQERLPEAQDLVKHSLFELYSFENVKTIIDSREEYFLGDIAFLHGYLSKIGDHTKFMQMKTVHGHRHRGEVTFLPIKGKILWELDVGYMADASKEALSYTPQKTSNSTLGWGEVDFLGPRFIPVNFK